MPNLQGTPFLDNYPTSDYIRHQREDDIPPCIDRSFYAYTSENLSTKEFEQRFAQFQGQNSNVQVEFVSSQFMHESLKVSEMSTLEAIFKREETKSSLADKESTKQPPFNVIVDLCGIFKLSNIYDVRSLILKHYGPDYFHYIYHIDQTNGSDRMFCIRTKNDVTFDEEFYKVSLFSRFDCSSSAQCLTVVYLPTPQKVSLSFIWYQTTRKGLLLHR